MLRMQVIYRIHSDAASINARAEALAVEQSIEMPPAAVRDARVSREVLGQVNAITAEASGAAYRVTLDLALETTGFEAGQMMNMLFGNSSLHPDIELIGLDLPDEAAARFGGPRHGIAGLRQALGAKQRALTCTALKPQGSTIADLAHLATGFAGAGIDVIKDDHGLADQASAPFHERVPAIQAAITRANAARNTTTLYAPTLNGGPQRMQSQIECARAAGVRAVLVTPMVSGCGVLQELAAEGEFIVLAHPALAGAGRIKSDLLFGTLFRLFGADAVIYPHYGGRFSPSRSTCNIIAERLRAPLGTLSAAMPVPAGGLQPTQVADALECYGRDVMLLIGGALLETADPARAAHTFVAQVYERSRAHGT